MNDFIECVICQSEVKRPNEGGNTSCPKCHTIYENRNNQIHWISHAGQLAGIVKNKRWEYIPSAISMDSAIVLRRRDLVGAVRHSDMTPLAKKFLLRTVLKFGREKEK